MQITCSDCGKTFEPDGRSDEVVCPRCGAAVVSQEDATIAPNPSADPDATMSMSDIENLWRVTLTPDASPGMTLKPPGAGSGMRTQITVKPRIVEEEGPGRKTGADYELIGLLGEGGMGVVYEARQTAIDRKIAVKMMKPVLALDEKNRAKFLAEAAITGGLDHPNIVPIHDLGETEDGGLFYAMKQVQGTSWSDVIGTKPQSENLHILLGVADAVAFAHSKGIMHRDLKPDNVMLGAFGEVLVLDWGLAASIDESGRADRLTGPEAIAGSPAYMAPEMASGDPKCIGTHSDQYLLGAILYEILTGQPPHAGATPVQCIYNAYANVIEPTDKRGELVDIALRAMATDPNDRFAGVKEFQQAIRDYQEHAESIRLAAKGRGDLVRARGNRDYDDYAQSLFAFREAISFWDGNEEARQGESEAVLAYARCASEKGDLDLAASLLDPDTPGHATLAKSIKRARRARAARVRRLRVFKSVAAASAAVVVAVLIAAYLSVSAARRQTEVALASRNELARKAAPEFLAKSRTLTEAGKFDEALAAIDVAIGLNGSAGDFHLHRGFVLQDLLRFEESMAAFDEAARRGAPAESVETNRGFSAGIIKLASGLKARTGEGIGSRPREVLLAVAEGFETQRRFAEASHAYGEGAKRRELVLKRWRNHLRAHGPTIFENEGELARRLTIDDLGRMHLNLSGIGDLEKIEFVRGMPLYSFNLGKCGRDMDLSPLRDTTVTLLNLTQCWHISSLSGLRGAPIEKLDLLMSGSYGGAYANKTLRSLDGLQESRLKWLSLENCRAVDSLEPLKGLPMTWLNIRGCSALESLDGLQGMQLSELDLSGDSHLSLGSPTKLTSVSALRDIPLKTLTVNRAGTLKSLDGLQGTLLEELYLRDCYKLADISALTDLPLQKLDLRMTNNGSYYSWDIWGGQHGNKALTSLAGLKGTKLKWLNVERCWGLRDFSVLGGLPLQYLRLSQTTIADLTPLGALTNLEQLDLSGCPNVRDLSPLSGIPLKELILWRTKPDLAGLKGMMIEKLDLHEAMVSDIMPLAGMPFVDVDLEKTEISDLSPLKGAKLKKLNLAFTRVTDLLPLRGAPLMFLRIEGTGVTDLTPLAGMKLETLIFDAEKITKGLDVVRNMKSILKIGPDPGKPMHPADFWKKSAADRNKREAEEK